MHTISGGGEEVVLQRRGPVLRVDNVTRLLVEVAHPLGKLPGVRDGGRQKHVTDIIGEENQGLWKNNIVINTIAVVLCNYV